uniref:Transposase n=1 Tax=Globodera pallida TaxID=36090 RepID=A0A183CCN9_GLOPA
MFGKNNLEFQKNKKNTLMLKRWKYEIAQMLNIRISTRYFWESKFKGILKPAVRKIYSEVEKQEKIAEFDKLKKEFKTRTEGMSYDMKKIDEKIAQKLGVCRTTFYNWKNEIGILKKQKRHTEAEKAEFVKQFYKIEEENPKMNKEKIAQMLNIPLPTINFWKRQFLNKADNGGPIDNVQWHGG